MGWVFFSFSWIGTPDFSLSPHYELKCIINTHVLRQLFHNNANYLKQKKMLCVNKVKEERFKHLVLFSSNVHTWFSQTFMVLTRHLPLITVFRRDQSRGHAAWSNQSVITWYRRRKQVDRCRWAAHQKSFESFWLKKCFPPCLIVKGEKNTC